VAPNVEGHRLAQADDGSGVVPSITIAVPSDNCISPVMFVVLKKNCGLYRQRSSAVVVVSLIVHAPACSTVRCLRGFGANKPIK